MTPITPQLVAAPGRARRSTGRSSRSPRSRRSQLFGVNADLLAAGRRVGRAAVRLAARRASSASASGCSSTSRSCRRSGSRSLVYVAVGYWAGRAARAARPAGRARPDRRRRRGDRGRDRRLLDHAVPARRRRARQLRCSCARSSPRSCSTRSSPLPVYALVRRWLLPRPARGPAPPPAPRLHDRRPVPAAAAHDRPGAAEDRRAADHAAAGAARRGARRASRFALFGDHLLPPLVPAGALGRPVPRQARDNRVRTRAHPGAARRRSSTATAARSSRTAVATVVQLDPERLPEAERDAAADAGASRSRAARTRPKGTQRRAGPDPDGRRRRRCAERLPAPRRACSDMTPADDPASASCARSCSCPYARVTLQHRRARRRCATTCWSARSASPACTSSASTCAATRSDELAAQLLGTVGEISPDELELRALPRRRPRARSSARTASSAPTTATCAASTAPTRITVDALGRPKGASAQAASPRRAAPLRSRSTSTCSGRRRRRSRRRSRATPGAPPARSSRSTRATARCSRWARTRASTRRSCRRPITEARYDAAVRRGRPASPLFNRAIAGAVSDRLDVQADHRAGRRSAAGLHHAGHADRRPGCVEIGEPRAVLQRRQAGPTARVDLRRALQVSSDVYFYTLGRDLNPLAGQPLQSGRAGSASAARPASTCPARSAARSPTARWRAQRRPRSSARCRQASATSPLTALAAAASPTCARGPSGDNVNLAVGQGDLQATPLQMAVAYAAIANGGRVVRPHLGARGRGRQRPRCCSSIDPPAPRGASRSTRAPRGAIMDGPARGDQRPAARRPTSSRAGTSALPGLRQDRHRARRAGSGDQSWYVVLRARRRAGRSSSPSPSSRAASAPRPPRPVARYMLAQWFGAEEDLRSPGAAARRVSPPSPPRIRDVERRAARRAAARRRGMRAAVRPGAAARRARAVRRLARDDRRRDRRTTSPASRDYYVDAPGASSSASACVVAVVLSRVDYSRLRELQVRRSTAC